MIAEILLWTGVALLAWAVIFIVAYRVLRGWVDRW